MLRRIVRELFPIGILCFAFSVMVGMMLFANDVAVKSGDPIEYMTNAMNIWHYESRFWPPLYSATIALVSTVAGDPFRAGQIVSMVSAICLVLLTWALGIKCFRSKKIALIGSILVAASPVVIRYSYVVGTDMMAAALFLASTYALASSGEDGRRRLVAAGVLAGLAYMTRYVYVGLLPVALFYLVCVRAGTRSEKLADSLRFFFPFALVAAPWTVICLMRYGDLHNMNHINIAFEMLDTTNSWLWWDEYERRYPTLLSLISAHPWQIVRYTAKNAFHFPTQIVFTHCLLAGALAVFGSLIAFRRPSQARMILLLNGIGMLLLTLPVKLDPRLYLWALPIILLYGSYVMCDCLEPYLANYLSMSETNRSWFCRLSVRNGAIGLSLLAALALSVIRVPHDFSMNNIDDEKRAGEFIRANTPLGTMLLTSSQNLAWYAERPYVLMTALKDVLADRLEQEVRMVNAQVFVYSKRHSTYTHPQLEFLLSPDNDSVPNSWRLIYHTQDDWPVAVYWVDD